MFSENRGMWILLTYLLFSILFNIVDPQVEIEIQGYGYEDEEKKGYIAIGGQKITTIEPEGFTRAPSPLEYSHLNETAWERTPEAVDLGRDSVDRLV